ncbi:excisionase [Ancylobacter vacuolatus]|uniref:Uncharacterized protein n=1 Tax=Ancylobacter vacuolatus TaxID=223389 RepID=A0ABU0DLR6_9HYPH|nr:excisionase [Ancylobacter vacuolatus]MDQ0349383.1 hypothetical protein [Ancylobacter vacuolatus]
MTVAANDNIDPNMPLRLVDAVRYGFPFGGMTAAGLRREAARGRLAIERIANKDFTTLAAIEEMRRLCLVQPPKLACGFERSGSTGAPGSGSPMHSGLSRTVPSVSPQDALKARLEKRKGA